MMNAIFCYIGPRNYGTPLYHTSKYCIIYQSKTPTRTASIDIARNVMYISIIMINKNAHHVFHYLVCTIISCIPKMTDADIIRLKVQASHTNNSLITTRTTSLLTTTHLLTITFLLIFIAMIDLLGVKKMWFKCVDKSGYLTLVIKCMRQSKQLFSNHTNGGTCNQSSWEWHTKLSGFTG